MINTNDILETINMIENENFDVRTITMGISLLDCIDSDLVVLNEKIYQKIYEAAKDLVKTGEEISREFGIPCVVGCVNATYRIKTGDKIRVNGDDGTVEILERV